MNFLIQAVLLQVNSTIHPVDLIEPEPEADEILFSPDDLSRLLAWAADGGTLLKVGMRTAILFWIINPVLLAPEMRTCEGIARESGVTRAAVDKLAVEFIETMNIQGLNQRTKEVRERCRTAQLKMSYST